MRQSVHEAAALARRLLRWSSRQQRDLPWRGISDPYAIWISEIMLQQTTVAAVHSRFGPFLKRFPDVRALARARQESVLAAWSGLGYYARARNLHLAAKIVCAGFGGRIPRDLESLRRLPGMGRYTAHALRAIAFGEFSTPEDANIRRVVSRLFATRNPESFLPGLVSRRAPGPSITALFDLGQLVCRPKNPACKACPLRNSCRAFGRRVIGRYPEPASAKKSRIVHLAAAALERGGKFLLRRRQSSWLGGLWEFPSVEGATVTDARRRLLKLIPGISRNTAVAARHSIAGRDLRIRVYRASQDAEIPDGSWMSPARIAKSSAPSLTRKIADRLTEVR